MAAEAKAVEVEAVLEAVLEDVAEDEAARRAPLNMTVAPQQAASAVPTGTGGAMAVPTWKRVRASPVPTAASVVSAVSVVSAAAPLPPCRAAP